MSSQVHLTELPRELRDMIYDELLDPEEYIHNPNTRKLTQANGSPIDLGLTLTCKQMRTEMYEQILRNRSVTFGPINPKDHNGVPEGNVGELLHLQRKMEAETEPC